MFQKKHTERTKLLESAKKLTKRRKRGSSDLLARSFDLSAKERKRHASSPSNIATNSPTLTQVKPRVCKFCYTRQLRVFPAWAGCLSLAGWSLALNFNGMKRPRITESMQIVAAFRDFFGRHVCNIRDTKQFLAMASRGLENETLKIPLIMDASPLSA